LYIGEKKKGINTNNKLDKIDTESKKEERMAKEKIGFEKTDMYELLLELYKVATAEHRNVLMTKMQLISSALVGMAILLTFSTFTYYLAKDGLLGDINIAALIVFLGLLVFGLFSAFGGYFLFIHKLQRTHVITALIIEKLIGEIISGEKTEDDIRNEIMDNFPYLRVLDKMNLRDTKWVKRSMKWQKVKEL
jgi:predicted histidine transporter YuiF (NhaC family)